MAAAEDESRVHLTGLRPHDSIRAHLGKTSNVAPRGPSNSYKGEVMSTTVLWIIAAIIAVVGIVQLVQGQILFGIVLLVVACLVGPGGYSVFSRR